LPFFAEDLNYCEPFLAGLFDDFAVVDPSQLSYALAIAARV
jgi:hypothetical protein